jgi:hypothetical protein
VVIERERDETDPKWVPPPEDVKRKIEELKKAGE